MAGDNTVVRLPKWLLEEEYLMRFRPFRRNAQFEVTLTGKGAEAIIGVGSSLGGAAKAARAAREAFEKKE